MNTEGKSPVGNANTAKETVRSSAHVTPSKMTGTGTKAGGRMRNFSKVAVHSALKGYK